MGYQKTLSLFVVLVLPTLSFASTFVDYNIYYLQAYETTGYLSFNAEGKLISVSDELQASHFLDIWVSTGSGSYMFIQVKSGDYDGSYICADRNNVVAACGERERGYLKWYKNRLQLVSQNGSKKGHLVYQRTAGRFYFDDSRGYQSILLAKVRAPYIISTGRGYAKLDTPGWLRFTSKVEEAVLFRDYKYAGNTFIKIESGPFSSNNSYLGCYCDSSVAAYRLSDAERAPVRWHGGKVLSTCSSVTAGRPWQYLVLNENDGYFYFKNMTGVSVVEQVKLGSMVSLYVLLQRPDIGSHTRAKAIEHLTYAKYGHKEDDGIMETGSIRAYRAASEQWDQSSIGNGILKSKYERLGGGSGNGPRMSVNVARDRTSMLALGMRVLGVQDTDDPLSQFVCITPSIDVAKMFKGTGHIYSFDVIPNSQLFSRAKQPQYLVYGGTRISNVRFEE